MRSVGAVLVVGALFFSACSGDGGDVEAEANGPDPTDTTNTTDTTDTPAAPEALRIVVTNDDGVDAAGIDALTEALAALPETEVTVVAPLENQSGSGGQTSDGELAVAEGATASGYDATTVDGFPADAVDVALGELGLEPHLVVSGVNSTQNLGPAVDLSGTVGAARAAVAEGVPGLALSQGIAEVPDYAATVELAVEWIAEHRDGLGVGDDGLVEVASINAPTCTAGEVRGLVELPPLLDPDLLGEALAPSDCTSTLTDPATDVEAFTNGFAVESVLDDRPAEPVAG